MNREAGSLASTGLGGGVGEERTQALVHEAWVSVSSPLPPSPEPQGHEVGWKHCGWKGETQVGAVPTKRDAHHQVCVLDQTVGSACGPAQPPPGSCIWLGLERAQWSENEATSGKVHTGFSLPPLRCLLRRDSFRGHYCPFHSDKIEGCHMLQDPAQSQGHASGRGEGLTHGASELAQQGGWEVL